MYVRWLQSGSIWECFQRHWDDSWYWGRGRYDMPADVKCYGRGLVLWAQGKLNAKSSNWFSTSSANALGEYGSTFLRGAFPSTDYGIAEFQTLFPGYTSDGANHINLIIHTSNSLPGSISHIGQVFFTDRWTDVVAMTSPYNQNMNHRVLNAQDSNYAKANRQGYNAIVE